MAHWPINHLSLFMPLQNKQKPKKHWPVKTKNHHRPTAGQLWCGGTSNCVWYLVHDTAQFWICECIIKVSVIWVDTPDELPGRRKRGRRQRRFIGWTRRVPARQRKVLGIGWNGGSVVTSPWKKKMILKKKKITQKITKRQYTRGVWHCAAVLCLTSASVCGQTNSAVSQFCGQESVV